MQGKVESVKHQKREADEKERKEKERKATAI
jgi:hypothetical protein